MVVSDAVLVFRRGRQSQLLSRGVAHAEAEVVVVEGLEDHLVALSTTSPSLTVLHRTANRDRTKVLAGKASTLQTNVRLYLIRIHILNDIGGPRGQQSDSSQSAPENGRNRGRNAQNDSKSSPASTGNSKQRGNNHQRGGRRNNGNEQAPVVQVFRLAEI